MPEREDAVAVVTAIQRLAEACRCDVVAEGIETDAQRQLLHGLGCRLGQGFGLARPAPPAVTTARLLAGLSADRRFAPVAGPVARDA